LLIESFPLMPPYTFSRSYHGVRAEAVRWGKRGSRINTISPEIIITPLAKDELNGPRGKGYRKMIELFPAGRAGIPDEVGAVGALLMGNDGTFITCWKDSNTSLMISFFRSI
jgi:NAD(P)-dependent dehydrogenase (short-subunit alcohol dehydrogenase family)